MRVNEFEDGFLEDFTALLKSLVPRDKYYAHDDWDRRTENICEEDMSVGNGHSHCMSMLLGSAGEAIPIRDGSSASAGGSACSSSSSTASATGAGSSRSSATSALGRADQAVRKRVEDELGPRLQVELPHHVGSMRVDVRTEI